MLHNQDNREHDILDSNDYYQFQGGMLAAVETLRGGKAASYFGDSSQPVTVVPTFAPMITLMA